MIDIPMLVYSSLAWLALLLVPLGFLGVVLCVTLTAWCVTLFIKDRS